MATFLLKTEPGTYSFDDLVRDKKATWDGVKNAAALIAIRSMKKGDEAFIYHTGDEKAIVGTAIVTRGAYEDPKNPGLNAKNEPKFAVVDLKPGRARQDAPDAREDQVRQTLRLAPARHDRTPQRDAGGAGDRSGPAPFDGSVTGKLIGLSRMWRQRTSSGSARSPTPWT
jgi:predicted RNA-binding protein with PUA-like domain